MYTKQNTFISAVTSGHYYV